MAFGLGFNKTKVLSNAEKYVQQGKLQNAIAEYEKVLKNDPKDLTVLNTVGDLHARLGDSERACQCFKGVGDAYAQQGFTVKAIAMYKKLTKLQSSLEGSLKLAELYTQQGLFNDARQQYLQVAEEFMRSGELEQAVRIFQKTLEMDPENVAMKVRLAEVYVRLGKKNEAWQIFSSAAEQLRSRGQVGPAEDILQRMLALDPNNHQALLLRGRNALDAGDAASAIRYLQMVPNLDSQPGALKALFQAYIATEKLSDAGVLANKLLSLHKDPEGVCLFVDALMKGGLHQEALNVYQEHWEPLLSANQAKTLEHLHSIIGQVRSEPESLEILLELFRNAGDTTHLTEVTELLAHACVKKGDLEKARDLYQQLSSIEPQNPIHTQNYQQVSAKLGYSPRSEAITAEEGAVIVDELEATAPSIEQDYPEDVAATVRAALTDAELFISYNMPAKALGPLQSVLSQAPQDVRLNQRLAALHTRAGRFAEAAVCCRTLERAYTARGYAEEAGRYGELASRYEERGGPASSESPAVSLEAAAPESIALPEMTEAVAEESAGAEITSAAFEAEAAGGEEFDISSEWEGSLAEKPESSEAVSHEAAEPAGEPASTWTEEAAVSYAQEADPAAPPALEAVEARAAGDAPVAKEEPVEAPPPADDLVPETVEEVRFYLKHAMRLQALAAMAKLEALSKDQQLIDSLHSEYETAFAPEPVSERLRNAPRDEAQQGEKPDRSREKVRDEIAAPEAARDELGEIVADLESSLGDGFEPAASARFEPSPVQPIFAKAATRNTPTLGEFVADLESALGDDFLPESAPQPAAAPAMAARAAAHLPTVSATAAAAGAPGHGMPASPKTLRQGDKAEARTSNAPAGMGGTDLSVLFSELKSELEEDTVTTQAEEDPETHYNLGVAFREMGLLDEAIGELQKVCHLVESGHAFPQVMQTYTWLAQCFLDKGVPEAAVRWYERALKIPFIDESTKTALHYELATAYETARNKDAALSHFMEVYGSNIDYRDVAERIKVLKS